MRGSCPPQPQGTKDFKTAATPNAASTKLRTRSTCNTTTEHFNESHLLGRKEPVCHRDAGHPTIWTRHIRPSIQRHLLKSVRARVGYGHSSTSPVTAPSCVEDIVAKIPNEHEWTEASSFPSTSPLASPYPPPDHSRMKSNCRWTISGQVRIGDTDKGVGHAPPGPSVNRPNLVS